jgi:hydroxyacylglutathione hydrolase
MKIQQIYTGCLAQGAYYIESEGEVAIIDPLREIQPYIDMATKTNSKIKYVFETHFHADFVSGHVTLAEKSGATIIYGPLANPSFKATIAKDNQTFQLGNVTFRVLHTPGHTMESTCYLLTDKAGKNHALFTGDTLFLGDVGRPDLAQKAADMTQEKLAEILFDSLRNKIMPLQDDLIIYPGHGAGSACGKNLSAESSGTLGKQKKTNYALREDMSKKEFVKEVTDGLLPPPQYFPLNVKMNKQGYKDIAEVLKSGTHSLNPEEFEKIANDKKALVLDVRSKEEFAAGHIPNSIFIGIDGGFAPWVGTLIGDTLQPILLIIPQEREKETITRMARVGFDNTLGYLKGGFTAWKEAGKDYDSVNSITVEELEMKTKTIPIFDLRKNTEFLSERIPTAINVPLSAINEHFNNFEKDEHFYIHCAGGYRSMIAASILKSRGIHNFSDISHGFSAIKKSAILTTDYICPSTL